MVVSFMCRMVMASTDTAFVGHLDNSTNGTFLQHPYNAKDYLDAVTLTDMVVGVLIVPPLAFNQVLNALVGQALGSGNKKMAGTVRLNLLRTAPPRGRGCATCLLPP